ncbi:MAG: energy-coupling factor ABC transporter permease, partial [Carboxydocellales bacterium]
LKEEIMSHIHIPDGVIPPVWLLLGFVLTGLGIAVALFMLKSRNSKEMVPKLGVVCALVLLAMSIPLGPIPAHLNLTVFMGIILGPWLGFIAAFIINLLLGFAGHGGLSVVGINTLLIALETTLGYGIFTLLAKGLTKVRAAALAVVFTLLLSNGLMLGVVSFTGVEPAMVIGEHGDDLQESPQKSHQQSPQAGLKDAAQSSLSSTALATGEQPAAWSRLAVAVLPIIGIGILLETVAITVLVNFISRIRPDILGPDSNPVTLAKPQLENLLKDNPE